MAVEKHQFDDEHREKIEDDDRVIIDLSPELRRKIRWAAHKNGLLFIDYIKHILEQTVPDEEGVIEEQEITDKGETVTEYRGHPMTSEVLEQVLRLHEEIKQHTNGRIFEDSAELINQMREERSQELEGRR